MGTSLTLNQRRVCSVLSQLDDKPNMTSLEIVAALGGDIKLASVQRTLGSLVSRKLVRRTGATRYKLLKSGHVAVVSDMTLTKLEKALAGMRISDIDVLRDETIVNLTTMLKNAKHLPKEALEQLAEVVEKHGFVANGKGVGLDSKRAEIIKGLMNNGDCIVLPAHATIYFQIDDRQGTMFGSGIYSQPYMRTGSLDKLPSVKQCSISIVSSEIDAEMQKYILDHSDTAIYKGRKQLRIRLENPVFSQVNLQTKKASSGYHPIATYVLEYCDHFDAYDATKHKN